MKLKTFESVTLYRYRYIIGYGLMITLGLLLLLFKLGSLTPGLANPEVQSLDSSHISAIAQKPINAPYRLLQATSHKVLGEHIWAVRLPSVLFGVIMIVGVYLFLRYSYTERVAVMGTILVGVSSTTAVFSRLGTSYIAMASVLAALLGATTWTMAAETIRRRHIIVLAITAAAALYTPLGIIWLAVLLLIHPKELRKVVGNMSNAWIGVGIFLFLLLILPIILSAAKDPGMLRDWLLLPATLAPLGDILFNIIRVPTAFLWRHTLVDPVTHLGNLPLLDMFTSIMVVLGALTLLFKPTLARTRTLLLCGIIGILASAISAVPANFIVLLPVTAILAAIGMERMLEEWYNTFPRNPFARIGALLPLAVIFGMTVFYHIHRSFVAWPRNQETKSAYNLRLPK